jgi:predicted oxidoreductase
LTAANPAGFILQSMGNHPMAGDADIIVVGAGLAGLVAATEIAEAGRRVIVVDQEGEQSLGGQAFWSFGGLFLVDSREQRRLGIKDSYDLALGLDRVGGL